MAFAAAIAFWFHTALCAGFLALVFSAVRGRPLVPIIESGPGSPGWGDRAMPVVFYVSAGLYLLYAELFLYRTQVTARWLGSL